MSRPFYNDAKKAKNVSFSLFLLVTLFVSTRFLRWATEMVNRG